MKIGNVVLLLFVISIVVHFTKLNNWFPVSGLMILGIGILAFALKFWEIHRENNKRRQLVNEIRGGIY
jgi:Na+/phosphate symporter